MHRIRLLALALGLLTILTAWPPSEEEKLSADETRQIAEEAFIYGFPLVMNYTVFYEYFVDKASTEYKAPRLQHGSRLHAERHGDCHTEQRHAVFIRRYGPSSRAFRRVQP